MSYKSILPKFFYNSNISTYILYILLFLVGIITGANENILKIVKKMKLKILLVVLPTIVGTTLGTYILSFFIKDISLKDLTAIGWGFGYYSLSSVLLKTLSNDTVSFLALLSNIFREIITLVAAPLLAKFFGKLAPISSGGATSMDTTLPIITKTLGAEYTVISIFHGIIITLLVPTLIILLYK